MSQHPSAIISPNATIGRDVQIGPFCVIEDNAVLGDGCFLESRCTIKKDTVLGPGNRVGEGAVIGGMPQHLKATGAVGRLEIGANNHFRENVTINRAMKPGQATIVGDNCLIMVGGHVAHDCVIGSNVVIANNSAIAGHCRVDDRAFVSAFVGVHQFCRVGRIVMTGAFTKLVKDVPPFVLVDGNPALVIGLNTVGLKRAGFSAGDLRQLKTAYKLVYRSGLLWNDMLDKLKSTFTSGPAAEFHAFFSEGTRGFTPDSRAAGNPTTRLLRDEDEAPSDATSPAAEVRGADDRNVEVRHSKVG